MHKIITQKDWQEFCNHRGKMLQDIILSNEFKEIEKRWLDAIIPQVKKIKKRFLWWTWEEERVLLPDWFAARIELLSYESNKKLLFSRVPNKTIEACLDWLVAREKIEQKEK